jgi:histidinol-phosphate aminotransferase
MKGWIGSRISEISKLDKYAKPEKVQGAIKLDSNENFALDAEFVKSVVQEAAKEVDLREYPLDQLDHLYGQLAGYVGVDERYLAAGSGSDQIIELLLSTLGGPRATAFAPTFSYLFNRCELHGIKVDKVPLSRSFELDSKEFVKSARRSDMVYICSPNNPTGNQLGKKEVMDIVDSLDSNLIIVDEAYVDFAGYSLSSEATARGNLVVLRTLSKAFGLAGARIGYMIANERLARLFRSTIQSPYPISSLSLAIASGVLARVEHVRRTIDVVISERGRVMQSLSRLQGIKTYRSDANFVFVETGSSYQKISESLAASRIVVKLLGNIAGHRGCMRVTIGTREMNDRFLQSVEGALS